ncbi:ABC transporter ATP-binding protein/permease [Prochlorococcus sp. AH-736-J10]|nr:ABC transporter ATP-binding protein/permease [Prochlorococcus sp. AH-736-J10]
MSAFFRLGTFWINGKLAAIIGSDIGSEAYYKSLQQSYEKYINSKSSEIISALNIHIDNVISFINFVLNILSSFFILLGLVTTLLSINTKVALYIGLFMGSFYILIGYTTEDILIKNSRNITIQNNQSTKIIQEAYGAFRDIILDKSQKIYLDIFKRSFYPYRNLRAQNNFLGVFPKFIIEAFSICIISIVALSLTSSNGDISNAFTTLGVFALGAQKILPSIQDIYGSISGIRGSKSSVEIIISLLNQPTPNKNLKIKKNPYKFKKKIVFDNTSYTYSEKSKFVIKNISFEINKGEKVGIIGKTGSGKSTTADLLMGLLKPTKGKIFIDGRDLNEESDNIFLSQWQSSIGHVPQTIYLTDRTIAENIAFNQKKEKIDLNAVKLAAKKAQISEFIESMPDKYYSYIGERGIKLSGGQRQRLGIARALYKGANILIFDEATSALDEVTEKILMNTLNEISNYLTVIIITHRLTTIKDCDKLIKLNNGKIEAIGKPIEVLNF